MTISVDVKTAEITVKTVSLSLRILKQIPEETDYEVFRHALANKTTVGWVAKTVLESGGYGGLILFKNGTGDWRLFSAHPETCAKCGPQLFVV